MAQLSKIEKTELLRLAGDPFLREDTAYITAHRHNPLLVNGVVDMDRLLEFLTGFNEFINHKQKPFKPMIDKDMKL